MSDQPTIGPDRSQGGGRRPGSHGRIWRVGVPVVAASLVLIIAVAGLVVVAMSTRDEPDGQSSGGGSSAPTSSDTGATSSTKATTEVTPQVGGQPTLTTSTGEPGTTVTLADLVPVGADATSVLAPQVNSCNGETSSYVPVNVIDGDLQTAWAPRESDGSGQHLVIDLGQTVQVGRVGLVPGYAKSGPLTSEGCRAVDRFDRNRHVVRVRYRFDDGTSVEQRFEPLPTMQSIDVDARTRFVDITVLETTLPAGRGVDDDTLISDVAVLGRR